MSWLQILALSASLILSSIGLSAFFSRKYTKYRKDKKYSTRQKKRYWKRKLKSGKVSQGKKDYAKERLKELSK